MALWISIPVTSFHFVVVGSVYDIEPRVLTMYQAISRHVVMSSHLSPFTILSLIVAKDLLMMDDWNLSKAIYISIRNTVKRCKWHKREQTSYPDATSSCQPGPNLQI
jgi:hypothetical protein